MFRVRPTLAGNSLPINTTLVVLNLLSLAAVVMALLPSFANLKWLLLVSGLLVMALSTTGLIIFHGRLLIATVLRLLTGSIFIVSGLVKANDPIGFSYKLAEYFEDGALAYRIKGWFGMPDFSLEFLIPYAVGIGIFICLLEIVLGVLLIIGGLPKLTGWLLLVVMLFFTFLTWHTANCDAHTRYKDRNTYELTNARQKKFAELKLELGKKDKSVKLVSRNANELVLDEWRTPQCVTDCGCFGDALKGSVGRSLTPMESLLKDVVLLYFAVWIFLARRIIGPNSVKRNWYMIPMAAIIVVALCMLFGWYFPLLFTFATLLLALWIYRSGGRFLGNHYGSALLVSLMAIGFVWFCVRYDSLRDFRPYAVGSNLKEKMLDGKPGVFSTIVVYRNTQSGELRKYDAASRDFLDSKIWEKKQWKFLRNETTVMREGRRASIDSLAFNPTLDVNSVTAAERNLPFVQRALAGKRTTEFTIQYLDGRQERLTRENLDFIVNTQFQILDSSAVLEVSESEISARDFILKSPVVILIVSRNLKAITNQQKNELAALYVEAGKDNLPVLLITSAPRGSIEAFRSGNLRMLPTFVNDDTELKVISRSNPVVVVLKRGIVKGKYPAANIPNYSWIKQHILTKK